MRRSGKWEVGSGKLQLPLWAWVRHLAEDLVGCVDEVRIARIDDEKFVVGWKLATKKTAERLRVFTGEDTDEDVAVNVVVADGLGFENVMRVKQRPLTATDAVHLCEPVGGIHIEEHNPAGWREQEAQFRQLAPGQRAQVARPERLILEQQRPADDGHRDQRFSAKHRAYYSPA